jgi:hypothetical protein
VITVSDQVLPAGATPRNPPQGKAEALQRVVTLCGRDDEAIQRAVASLWDDAFEAGRLEALDELQDRFCVCMK